METFDINSIKVDGDRCWLVAQSNINMIVTTILPATVLVAVTLACYLKTMAVTRGARQLLLTDNQFNHISQCMSLVLKLLPLLAVTLALAISATMSGAQHVWTVFQLAYSCHGLVTAIVLTCNCDLVKSYSNVSLYFNRRNQRGARYGTGEVVSATDLNLLVWKDDSNVV